jgi:hypothetical protein
MNQDNIQEELREYLTQIISMDHEAQRRAIETIYDEQCYLESPYLVLQGREEIIRSYNSLATNNMEIQLNIGSITFDSVQQTCMVDIQQRIRPKVLCVH